MGMCMGIMGIITRKQENLPLFIVALVGFVLWLDSYTANAALIIALAVAPWYSIWICRKYRNKFSVYDEYTISSGDGRQSNDLGALFFIACALLAMAGVVYGSLTTPLKLIAPSFAIVVVMTSILVFAEPALRRKCFTLFFVVILLFGYAAGLITVTNQHFDYHEPIKHRVKIFDKTERKGKGGGFFLNLDAWSPQQKSIAPDIRVKNQFYNAIIIGQDVCVFEYPGALFLNWYTVTYAQACN